MNANVKSRSSLLSDIDIDYHPSVTGETRRSCNRRTALKVGVGVVAAYPIITTPSRAEAGFWGFVGRAAFGALIGWFVDQTMDAVFSRDADRLGLTYDKEPTPTSSAFNNQFAAPWYATNRDYYLHARRTKSGQRLGFGPYLLDYDLNGEELTRLKKEVDHYGCALAPCTARESIRRSDAASICSAVRAYGLSPCDVCFDYKREYRDTDGGRHLGVGVTLNRDISGIPAGSKRHLLA